MSRDRDSSRRSAIGAKADRILEQALKHELRAAGTPPAAQPALRSFSEGGCLDAETLGAWADDGLDAAAMLAAEAHVSTCTRCQAMVAAFTRGTAPGTVAPDAPKAPYAPHAPHAPGTLSLWWKWLAPLAAGAAAVTLWMVVPEQQQVAVAPPQRPAEADRAPAVAPAADPPASPSAPASTAARERQAPRDSLAAGAREDRQQQRDEPKQEKALAEAAVTARENATPAAATPQVAPAPAAAPSAAARDVGGVALGRAFAPLEIISPDPARRWRISGGAIERSEDAGASWAPIRASGGETITAGTSPAGSICWLIGTNGLVLITIDGITFARVPLPEPVDLTSITAADARNATVTTADGRRFRTDDSGRTWRAF
jgi:hypothetical protein